MCCAGDFANVVWHPAAQNAYSRSGISRVSPASRAVSMFTIMSQIGSRISVTAPVSHRVAVTGNGIVGPVDETITSVNTPLIVRRGSSSYRRPGPATVEMGEGRTPRPRPLIGPRLRAWPVLSFLADPVAHRRATGSRQVG